MIVRGVWGIYVRYRIVVEIVSIPLHMGTDAVRENILLAMIVVVRIAPWMVGKKR